MRVKANTGRTAAVLLTSILFHAMPAIGQGSRPTPILPDTVPYAGVPQVPGLAAKWLVGNGADSALYLMRVRLASGTRLPPHTHPDTRFTQVLSGTLSVGFDAAFDSSVVAAIPSGGVFVTPAGIPHFVWARDGEVVYQETGKGPTGNEFVERAGP